MLEVNEIDNLEEFIKLRDSWNEVLSKSNDNSPTLTWEHTLVSIKNFESEKNLQIICVKDQNEIIAIAPLKKTNYGLKFMQYNIIEALDFGHATDYSGIIIGEQELNCLKIILKCILKKNWDYLRINDIPENSTTMTLLKAYKSQLPNLEMGKGEICPYIEIPDSFDKFLNGLKPHFRKELLRRLRGLESDYGKVEVKKYHEIGSLEHSMDLFFKFHTERWEALGQSGGFSSPLTRRLFVERAKYFSDRGWLGLYFLTVNNVPVAADYSLEYDQRLFGCSSGFDTKYSRYSVSNLLVLKLVEKCIERGFTEYDFMKGNEAYKSKWTSKYRTNYNLRLSNQRVYSRFMRAGLEIKNRGYLICNRVKSG